MTSGQCTDTNTMAQLRKSLEVTDTICLGYKNSRLEVDNLTEEKIKAAEDEKQRWINSYYNLKKEYEEPEEEVL